MITTQETAKKVDAYWAGYFGLKPADLKTARTHVVTHVALQGFDGALVFRHGDACIVSVPARTPDIERNKLRAATPEQVFDAKFLSGVFVIGQEKVTGPAWVGVADRNEFKPVKSDARMLGDGDEEALSRMADGCGEMAWAQSKLLLDLKPMFGKFEGSDVVAAAAYRVMGVLAYIGVLAHPRHRGKGYAKEVASAAMTHAYEKGLIPMWRTMESNPAAIGLARHLGFQHYASTLDVQLVETEF